MSRILVVDDEMNIRELVNRTLTSAGHAVTTVPTRAQALDTIFREPFDLVVLDVQLGADSGLDLLKTIREKNTKIPVVIYSGAVTPEVETAARQAGATDVLRKDIGMDVLVKQIGTVVRAGDCVTAPGVSVRKDAQLLVVDDQANIRGLVKNFFAGKGYSIIEAPNGLVAVDVVRAQKITAVLLDIEMPVMDGLTALPLLLAINPQMGIVMTTGVQDDAKVKKAINMGAYGYVLKPFDFLYLELVVMSRLAIAQGGAGEAS